ncbi:MAG: class A beta-lactamase-related serine hydrolase [Anaerolineales bacterium]|nr:class A beta-lactamase-related serine hydrolase [Anaerolineales bacterium]
MNKHTPSPFRANATLDHTLAQIFDLYHLPGLAIGVVIDQEIVYTKSLGVRNIETKDPITPYSLFSLASISKTFVAAAIMQLVEQGKISLDTTLSACLPYFQIDDPRFKQITISQMLSHISGMPDIDDYMWDPPEFDDGALARYVRDMGKETLVFSPGEKFVYSNTAYDILGQVIAEVSGQLFEDYIEQHILLPLDMIDSTFLYKNASPDLLTSPYLNLPDLEPAPLYPYTRPHAPCGSLHSSVIELCHWAIANLNRGKFEDTKILNSASYNLLWQPYAIVEEKNPDEHVGLCWFLNKFKGERTISHSGGDIGFRTNLALLPDKSAGVVVLSNTYPAPIEWITQYIFDLILENEPSPPKPPIFFTLSPILKNKGLEAAIEEYHTIKETQPDEYELDPEYIGILGFTLIDIKRPSEAIHWLKLGIEIHPGSDPLYYELAKAYQQIGVNDEAAETCQKCLEINPAHWEAARLLNELKHD